MNTSAAPNEPNDEPGREEEGASPGPPDLIRRAEVRAERQTRDFVRELQKQAARGAAFQAGKEALKEMWRLLTEN